MAKAAPAIPSAKLALYEKLVATNPSVERKGGSMSRVLVTPHNPLWTEMFRTESDMVCQALGPNAVAIHHIGSTSIPGIFAKPIIDMLVEAADINAIDGRNAAMEAIGYEVMGECGLPGRRYFRKDNAEGIRTHHVHTFATRTHDIERHLAFRDFMRAHPALAEQYSDLKRKLARAHPDSIELYMDGKDGFIKDMERRAAQWRANSGVVESRRDKDNDR
jgi:GrpB-like predicted nucleotidyltransferase (UPF0157 family)